MKPVRVHLDTPQPPEHVYDFPDVMTNHEPFTNHMLRDWEYSGPDRGIGSKARVTATAGGRRDTVEIEVIAAERPNTIVERNVSAGGRRIGTGTYRLEPLPTGAPTSRLSTPGSGRRSATASLLHSSAQSSLAATSVPWRASLSSSPHARPYKSAEPSTPAR